MKRLVLVSLGLAMTTAAVAHAARQVKPAADSCSNAHALLVASQSGQHDHIWGEIRKIIQKGNGKWQLVDDYEPGVTTKVSLRQYDLKYHEGASAYVMHCGHGGTCNDFANTFLQAYPDWYSPEVFCGAVPEALQNPQKP